MRNIFFHPKKLIDSEKICASYYYFLIKIPTSKSLNPLTGRGNCRMQNALAVGLAVNFYLLENAKYNLMLSCS